jgi:hypothetical protein
MPNWRRDNGVDKSPADLAARETSWVLIVKIAKIFVVSFRLDFLLLAGRMDHFYEIWE